MVHIRFREIYNSNYFISDIKQLTIAMTKVKNRKAANKGKKPKQKTPKNAQAQGSNLKAPPNPAKTQKPGKNPHGKSSTTYRKGCTKSEDWTSDEKVSISKVSRIIKV